MSGNQSARSQSIWRASLRRLLHHKIGMFGAIIVLLTIFLAIFGQFIAPYNPTQMFFADRFSHPTLKHPLGTDNFGRDTLSRVMHGARVSIQVGLIAVGISGVFGTLLGLIAGYTGSFLEQVIMRFMDILLSFPPILLAIALMAVLGKGANNAMIAIGIVYAPIFARIARGATVETKEETFVEAANSIGASKSRILFRHILPIALPLLIVEASLSMATAILAEAALSFFGLGVQPPQPSWGRMLSQGRNYLNQSVWMGIFPGFAIMFTVMGFNFLGDGLRDVLDPKLKNT